MLTKGSNAETGIGFGIFCDELDISVSLRLPSTCTVPQMEIYVINVAAKKICQFSFCTSTLDSFFPLKKTLISNEVKSNIFMI